MNRIATVPRQAYSQWCLYARDGIIRGGAPNVDRANRGVMT